MVFTAVGISCGFALIVAFGYNPSTEVGDNFWSDLGGVVSVIKTVYRKQKEYYLAHAALVLAAHSRSFLTYTGIARLTGLPERGNQLQRDVGQLLGEIGEDEYMDKRPILSALVVQKIGGKPSFGFYKLTDQLGITKGMSESKKTAFLQKQQSELFKFYAVDPKQRSTTP